MTPEEQQFLDAKVARIAQLERQLRVCTSVRKNYEGMVNIAMDHEASAMGLLESLRAGSCWCGVGINDPRMGGIHDGTCLQAQALLKEWKEASEADSVPEETPPEP